MGKLNKTAVVTGASSGIGAAAARQLSDAGFDVILGARRLDRLKAIASEIGGTAIFLDVTDQASVDSFIAACGQVNVLINNAGGALGLGPVSESDTEFWRRMYDTNVLGLMRMTRALLPSLIESGTGHIVNITSVAAIETYPGGGGYTAAKHASRAVTQTLRQELIGKPVRVTDIAPGMVETEFSVVRFGGDKTRADKVYEGLTPLVADDVAEAIVWAVTRPSHVNIDEILIKPLDQVSATVAHRTGRKKSEKETEMNISKLTALAVATVAILGSTMSVQASTHHRHKVHHYNTWQKMGRAIQYTTNKDAQNISVDAHKVVGHKSIIHTKHGNGMEQRKG